MEKHRGQFCEKRAYPRRKVTNNSAVLLSPSNTVSYRVLDVSKAGLGFIYVKDDSGHNLENQLSKITIYSDGYGYIELKAQIVSDIDLIEEFGKIGPQIRRCGVEFIYDSDDQKELINGFIDNAEGCKKDNDVPITYLGMAIL